MSTDATVGYGSTIGYGTDGTTYTSVAQTVDLAGPEPEIGDVGITNNDSPDNTKEYMPGMIEPGEIEYDVVYKKDVCNTLYTMFGDGTTYYWKETFPDGSTWTFKGYLKKFGTETKTEDEAIKNTISIKLTNKPVFTAGS
jgi:hypothetical protein